MTTPTPTRPLVSDLYDLVESGGRRLVFRWHCKVCGTDSTWWCESRHAHDGARYHLAHAHPELGIEWA